MLTPQEQAELAQLEAEEKQGQGITDPARGAKYMGLAEKSAEPEPFTTRGGEIGGVAGSLVGAPFGAGGRMLGAGLGAAAIDNLVRQYEATSKPWRGMASAVVPEPGQSLKQGAIQGGVAGLMELLGAAATRLGLPRAGATLQATSPTKSVLRAAPDAAGSISTPVAAKLEAASATPGALREMGPTATAGAGQDLAAAEAAAKAKSAQAVIQPQLKEAAIAQAPKNAALGKAVDEALDGGPAFSQEALNEASAKARTPSEALMQMLNSGGPSASDALKRQAFREPFAIKETAGSPDVARTRSAVAEGASRMGMLGKANETANEALSEAVSRGVDSRDPTAIAGELAGLKALFGKEKGGSPATELAARMVGGYPAQLAARAAPSLSGGMSETRAAQTLAALLADRGEPIVSKDLSGGAATSVGGAMLPAAIEEAIGKLRESLYGKQSQ